MANSPLFVALEREAEEIVVVLLSPVGHRPLPPPTTMREGLERLLEHFLIGSCHTTMPVFNGQPVHACDEWRPARPKAQKTTESLYKPRISVIAPTEMLGFTSLLNFSARQVNRLIQAGYHNARSQYGLKG